MDGSLKTSHKILKSTTFKNRQFHFPNFTSKEN